MPWDASAAAGIGMSAPLAARWMRRNGAGRRVSPDISTARTVRQRIPNLFQL